MLIDKWKEKTKANINGDCSECGRIYPNPPEAKELLKDLTEALTELEGLVDAEIERNKSMAYTDPDNIDYDFMWKIKGLEQAKQYIKQTLGGGE